MGKTSWGLNCGEYIIGNTLWGSRGARRELCVGILAVRLTRYIVLEYTATSLDYRVKIIRVANRCSLLRNRGIQNIQYMPYGCDAGTIADKLVVHCMIVEHRI